MAPARRARILGCLLLAALLLAPGALAAHGYGDDWVASLRASYELEGERVTLSAAWKTFSSAYPITGPTHIERLEIHVTRGATHADAENPRMVYEFLGDYTPLGIRVWSVTFSADGLTWALRWYWDAWNTCCSLQVHTYIAGLAYVGAGYVAGEVEDRTGETVLNGQTLTTTGDTEVNGWGYGREIRPGPDRRWECNGWNV